MRQIYVFLMAALFSASAFAQNEVNVTPTTTWAGFMNWYELDMTTAAGASAWGVDALKTVVDATENTVSLYPNYNVYISEKHASLVSET